MPLRLTLIRHGQTVCNVTGKHQTYTSPLSEVGLRQAELLARRFAGQQIDALYSSDLDRALSTAAAVSQTTGVPITPDVRLREIDVGIFKGCTPDEARRLNATIYQQWRDGEYDAVCPGGECARDVEQRAAAFLNDIASRHADATVLAITHGQFLQAVAAHVLRTPPPFHRRLGVPNTGCNHLTFDPAAGWTIHTWGDVQHLTQITAANPT